MKILHIINTLDYGGAQSVLQNLITRWEHPADSHEVISLLPPGALSQDFKASGIPLYHLEIEPGKPAPAKFFRLIRLIRNIQPNLIQTWLYHADLIGGLAARLAHPAPIIWGVHHTTPDRNAVKPSTWRVIRLLIRLSKMIPTRIIYCTDTARTTHEKLGYSSALSSTIHNGVDTNVFKPDPYSKTSLLEELGLSPEKRLIGMFARYNQQKDFPNFLKAAAILAPKMPDTHFILAGDGLDEDNQELFAQIVREDLSKRVHLLGRREDMPRIQSAIDLATLSSAFGEALPISLCEAMACGTLCVGTDVGDIPSLISNTGIVVPPKEPDKLAKAWQSILELPTNDHITRSNKARDHIIKQYNLISMISKYHLLYQETSGAQ